MECLGKRAGNGHAVGMAILGKRNQLQVLRQAPPGYFLDGGEYGEILLPGKYVPAGLPIGSEIEVFLYRDSEDRLVATTQTPIAEVGDFAFLRIVGIQPGIGAFLDWGLDKDLLLPRREQNGFHREGDRVVVHVCIDEISDRIVATMRLNRWLSKTPPTYAKDQPVRLLISGETPLGYNAIVDNAHRGLLYHTDLATRLEMGQSLDGFARAVRPDGKIDLALDRTGFARIAPLTTQILEALRAGGGSLPYDDSSPPEAIRSAFGVSKKAFKQAVGALFRKRLIILSPGSISLAPSSQNSKATHK